MTMSHKEASKIGHNNLIENDLLQTTLLNNISELYEKISRRYFRVVKKYFKLIKKIQIPIIDLV
jgi:hypothetical protein